MISTYLIRIKVLIIVADMKQFLKYSAVGIVGTLVDVGSLYVFVDFAGLPVVRASILSFALAVLNNYIFNRFWTFKHHNSFGWHKRFLKFVALSVVGLWLNSFAMYFFVHSVGIWYVYAKILASVVVFLWNYIGNRYWTFRPEKKIW